MHSAYKFNYVLDRVGVGVKPHPPAYLSLLNPQWSENGRQVLSNVKGLATELQENLPEWSALVLQPNWRYTLIGCSALMLTKDAYLFDALVARLALGSWVAPQLAGSLFLKHKVNAIPVLKDMMHEEVQIDAHSKCKRVFSAYAALKRMGNSAAQNFENSNLYRWSESSELTHRAVKAAKVDAITCFECYVNFYGGIIDGSSI